MGYDIEGRKAFGKWIKGIRKKRKLSQFKAGVLVGYRSNGTINSVEQGLTPLPIEKIFDIAYAYDISVQEILEKLKEYEPEQYRKFKALEERFERRMLRKMNNSYQLRNEVAAYRKASKVGGFGEFPGHDHNIYYRTLRRFIPLFLKDHKLKTLFGDRDHGKALSYSI